MLTHSALEEREWLGLRFIRSAFQANTGAVRVREPWSSIEASEFARAERVLFLATLLSDNQHVLLRAARDGQSGSGGESLSVAALSELHVLCEGLDQLRRRVSDLLDDLNALAQEIATARSDTTDIVKIDPPAG